MPKQNRASLLDSNPCLVTGYVAVARASRLGRAPSPEVVSDAHACCPRERRRPQACQMVHAIRGLRTASVCRCDTRMNYRETTERKSA